uniref:Armadillo-like repeats domain-containing protein n=1 Tax=Nelumbo nucifera TaxID=4432 RepID=A0A822ZBA8_NELNU|nr:TPA_asm: hypothetical protein HUJ06_014649 [Nelumbo nucifera]
MLDDAQVAEILNEISRRIVRKNGPVVMDMSRYSEKGLKRKLPVQALFGKIFYLSELSKKYLVLQMKISTLFEYILSPVMGMLVQFRRW